MLNRISRLKITPKFLAFVLLLGVLPLLILGATSLQTASSVLEQESARYTAELVGNQSTYLRLQLAPVEALMGNLSNADELRNVVDANNPEQDTYDKIATQARIGYILNNFANIQGLISIDIFTRTGLQFHYGDTLNTENVNEAVKATLTEQAAEANGQTVWTGLTDNVNINSPAHKVIPAVRQLQRYDSTNLVFVPTALMVVNYDPSFLYDYFSKINFGEGAYMIIVDGSGHIVYHPDQSLIGTLADATMLTNLNDINGTKQQNISLNNETYLLTAQSASIHDWTIAALIPLGTLRSKISPISANTLITLLLSLLLVLIAAVFMNYLWLTPIRQIIGRFALIQRGEPAPEPPLPMRSADEIGELTQWFNLFVKKLEELETASQLANESARLKSEFLSTMSHEMRTPLNAIEGFTGIMLSGMGVTLEPLAYGMLERVAVNNQRLLSLVNDFLDLSRIESGRWDIAERPIIVRKLAEQWHRQTSVLAEKKGLRLDLTVDPQLPETIYGDDEALTKVVLNLLGNAVKFTDKGSIELAVKRVGNSLSIQVSDTGVGIPPHAHEFIFDEFRQVDMSSTRKQGGTGLGLAIVKKMVRLMKGTVSLRSEVGKGSTFTIVLPLVLEAQSAMVAPVAIPA